MRQVISIAQPIIKKLETQVKAWTKPTTDSLVGGMVADMVKSKEQLIMENALLHQQVIVLKRQVNRPQLTAQDRRLLAVLMVKPDTVLRWVSINESPFHPVALTCLYTRIARSSVCQF